LTRDDFFKLRARASLSELGREEWCRKPEIAPGGARPIKGMRHAKHNRRGEIKPSETDQKDGGIER